MASPTTRSSSGSSVGPTTGGGPAAPELLAELRTTPFTEKSVAAAAELLRLAGVTVVPTERLEQNVGVEATTSPIMVTAWQTRNLAIQAANLDGPAGAELAEVFPAPAGVPPMPYLVLAWANSYPGRGAAAANHILAGQHASTPMDIHFPSLVLPPGWGANVFVGRTEIQLSAQGSTGTSRQLVERAIAMFIGIG